MLCLKCFQGKSREMCIESSSTHQSVFTTHGIKAVCRIMIAEKVEKAGPREDGRVCGVAHADDESGGLTDKVCDELLQIFHHTMISCDHEMTIR